jgi:hypothetical protein
MPDDERLFASRNYDGRAEVLPMALAAPIEHDDAVEWVVPEFSKRRVDKAGKVFCDPEADEDERSEAAAIVNNWRAAHGFPLNGMQVALRNRARTVDPNATVAQRLKRMASIEAKLTRLDRFRLTDIQDIGGCRAIVSNVAALRELMAKYDRGRENHELKKVDDYVWDRGPRHTGYRSVHYVYSYQGTTRAEFDSLRIELQLRTRLQHAWATAVETVGTFTDQPLKAGHGDPEWLRFFALASCEIAYREHTPRVDGTPTTRRLVRAELRALAEELQVVKRLRAYQTTMHVGEHGLEDGTALHYFILVLTAGGTEVSIYGFTKRELEWATDSYQQYERDLPNADVVLISVDDLQSIKRAYPNNFADTGEFLSVIEAATR